MGVFLLCKRQNSYHQQGVTENTAVNHCGRGVAENSCWNRPNLSGGIETPLIDSGAYNFIIVGIDLIFQVGLRLCRTVDHLQ